MPDLSPYSEDAPAEEEPKAGYLLIAGALGGLIIAIGSQALGSHFQARPELAQADPLLVQVMAWARWIGWILFILSSALLILSLSQKKPANKG